MTLSAVTLVNSDALYAQFKQSLSIQDPRSSIEYIPVRADSMGWNAATALNNGIGQAHGDWVMLAHQDVIFPVSWYERVTDILHGLSRETAIVGLVGIRPNGGFAGHVRDPHGHLRWLPLPAKVMSIDEHVIFLRRSSAIRFDPENPGFHCYGTDICYAAEEGGLESIVIDAPVVHLSGGRTDDSYDTAAAWLLGKWGRHARNVIPTCARMIYSAGLGNLPYLLRIRHNWQACQRPGVAACNCLSTELAE